VLHVDHVVPLALGGVDAVSNLVSACEECNLGKHDNRLPPESEQAALDYIAGHSSSQE